MDIIYIQEWVINLGASSWLTKDVSTLVWKSLKINNILLWYLEVSYNKIKHKNCDTSYKNKT